MNHTLPDGWESDYDGTRWFYRYKASGITQYRFPQPGDEFPQFIASDAPPVTLAPEELLESQRQVQRSSTRGATPCRRETTVSSLTSVAGPVSTTLDDDRSSLEQFKYEDFMYLGPVSPLEKDKNEMLPGSGDDAAAKTVPQSGSIGITSSLGATPLRQAATPIISGEPVVPAPDVEGITLRATGTMPPSHALANLVTSEPGFSIGDPSGFAFSAPATSPTPSQAPPQVAQLQSNFLLEDTTSRQELSAERAWRNPTGYMAELPDPNALAEVEAKPPPVELPAISTEADVPAELPDTSFAPKKEDRREELREAQMQRHIDAETERRKLGLMDGRGLPGKEQQSATPSCLPAVTTITEEEVWRAQTPRQIDSNEERKPLGLEEGFDTIPPAHSSQPPSTRRSISIPPTIAQPTGLSAALAGEWGAGGFRARSASLQNDKVAHTSRASGAFTPMAAPGAAPAEQQRLQGVPMPCPGFQPQSPSSQTTPLSQPSGFQIKRKPTKAKYTSFNPRVSMNDAGNVQGKHSSMVASNSGVRTLLDQEVDRTMTGPAPPPTSTIALKSAVTGPSVPPKVLIPAGAAPRSGVRSDIPGILASPIPQKKPMERAGDIPGTRARHESISGNYGQGASEARGNIPTSFQRAGPGSNGPETIGIKHAATVDSSSLSGQFGPASAPVSAPSADNAAPQMRQSEQTHPRSPIPNCLPSGQGPGHGQSYGRPTAASALPPQVKAHLGRTSTDSRSGGHQAQRPAATDPHFQPFRFDGPGAPPLDRKPQTTAEYTIGKTTEGPGEYSPQPVIPPYPVTPKLGLAIPSSAPRPEPPKERQMEQASAPYPEDVRPLVTGPYLEERKPVPNFSLCHGDMEPYTSPMSVHGSRLTAPPPAPPAITSLSAESKSASHDSGLSVQSPTSYQPSAGVQNTVNHPSISNDDSEISTRPSIHPGSMPASAVATFKYPEFEHLRHAGSPPQSGSYTMQNQLSGNTQGSHRPPSIARPVSMVSSICSSDPEANVRPMSTMSEIEPAPRPENQQMRQSHSVEDRPFPGNTGKSQAINPSGTPGHFMGVPGPAIATGPRGYVGQQVAGISQTQEQQKFAARRPSPPKTSSVNLGPGHESREGRFSMVDEPISDQTQAGRNASSMRQEGFQPQNMWDQRPRATGTAFRGLSTPIKPSTAGVPGQDSGSALTDKGDSTSSVSQDKHPQTFTERQQPVVSSPPWTPAINNPLSAPKISPASGGNESSRSTSIVQARGAAAGQYQPSNPSRHQRTISVGGGSQLAPQKVHSGPEVKKSTPASSAEMVRVNRLSIPQPEQKDEESESPSSPPPQRILIKMQAAIGKTQHDAAPARALAGSLSQKMSAQSPVETPVSGRPQLPLTFGSLSPQTEELQKQSTARKLLSRLQGKSKERKELQSNPTKPPLSGPQPTPRNTQRAPRLGQLPQNNSPQLPRLVQATARVPVGQQRQMGHGQTMTHVQNPQSQTMSPTGVPALNQPLCDHPQCPPSSGAPPAGHPLPATSVQVTGRSAGHNPQLGAVLQMGSSDMWQSMVVGQAKSHPSHIPPAQIPAESEHDDSSSCAAQGDQIFRQPTPSLAQAQARPILKPALVNIPPKQGQNYFQPRPPQSSSQDTPLPIDKQPQQLYRATREQPQDIPQGTPQELQLRSRNQFAPDPGETPYLEAGAQRGPHDALAARPISAAPSDQITEHQTPHTSPTPPQKQPQHSEEFSGRSTGKPSPPLTNQPSPQSPDASPVDRVTEQAMEGPAQGDRGLRPPVQQLLGRPQGPTCDNEAMPINPSNLPGSETFTALPDTNPKPSDPEMVADSPISRLEKEPGRLQSELPQQQPQLSRPPSEQTPSEAEASPSLDSTSQESAVRPPAGSKQEQKPDEQKFAMSPKPAATTSNLYDGGDWGDC